MNHHYSDIRDKLGEPLWFDEHAVPRYCDFAPNQTANIYADECVLYLIRCQNCNREFRVCESTSRSDVMLARHMGNDASMLSERVAHLHYGDPPNIQCCPSGPTMNSEPVRVLEFWSRVDSKFRDWSRRPELEIAIQCDWRDS